MHTSTERAVSPRAASGISLVALVLAGGLLMGPLWTGCTSERTAPSPDTTATAASTSRSTPAPAATETSGNASAPAEGNRPLAEKLEDARVETRVKQALVQQRSLRVFPLQPAVTDGRVTLRGDVNTRDQYDEAARTARRVEGVTAVQNDLTVGGEPVTPEASANEEEAAAEGRTNQETVSAAGVYHTVQTGESLWTIAQQYGTSIQRLRALNDLRSDGLQPGQRIRVR